MNNRRHFLIQGALATYAFMYLKEFTGNKKNHEAFNLNEIKKEDKLTVLHGAYINTEAYNAPKINNHILKLSAIDADKKAESIAHTKFPIEISKKGNINVGIIHLPNQPFNADNPQQIIDLNSTALFLKESAACHFIICNYYEQPNNKFDHFTKEKRLASQSLNIDLIVCKKEELTSYSTFIANNKSGNEVIINATGFNNLIGKIDIHFNNELEKINVVV